MGKEQSVIKGRKDTVLLVKRKLTDSILWPTLAARSFIRLISYFNEQIRQILITKAVATYSSVVAFTSAAARAFELRL